MIGSPEKKPFRQILCATPTTKYYIQYVDPEDSKAGCHISPDMTETDVYELSTSNGLDGIPI
jgi:hypothetical protein